MLQNRKFHDEFLIDAREPPPEPPELAEAKGSSPMLTLTSFFLRVLLFTHATPGSRFFYRPPYFDQTRQAYNMYKNVHDLIHTNENLYSCEFSSKEYKNTPGTTGGPGGRDRTLALKSRKTLKKKSFFL